MATFVSRFVGQGGGGDVRWILAFCSVVIAQQNMSGNRMICKE